MMAWSRRRFLALLGGALAPELLPRSGRQASAMAAEDLLGPLRRAMGGTQSARVLGAEVARSGVLGARSRSVGGRLAERIRSRLPAGRASPGERDVLAAFRRSVKSDFRHGRIARVDGWILSETEAMVLAWQYDEARTVS